MVVLEPELESTRFPTRFGKIQRKVITGLSAHDECPIFLKRALCA
jgi:hypothetical protein